MSEATPRLPRIVVAVPLGETQIEAFTLLREPEIIDGTLTRLHHVDGAANVRTTTLREVYDPRTHVAVRDSDLDLREWTHDDETNVLAMRVSRERLESDRMLTPTRPVATDLAMLGGPMPAPKLSVDPRDFERDTASR